VAIDEPKLEEIGGDGLALFAREGLLDPREALDARFALDEDGAEFALLGEVLDDAFVERFLVLEYVCEDEGAGGGGHLRKDVCGTHGGEGRIVHAGVDRRKKIGEREGFFLECFALVKRI